MVQVCPLLVRKFIFSADLPFWAVKGSQHKGLAGFDDILINLIRNIIEI
jgi:hypothetical protein